jgi:hypothetical protein
VIVARIDGTIRDLAFSAGTGQKLSGPITTIANFVSGQPPSPRRSALMRKCAIFL